MGEAQFAQCQTSQACQEAIEQCEQVVDEAMRVQTPGGVFEVQWSSDGSYRHGTTCLLCRVFASQWLV